MRRFLDAINNSFQEYNPFHWRERVNGLTTSHGMMPSAMMMAAAGTILFFNFGIGRLGNIGLVQALQLTTFGIWFLLGGVASTIVAIQSIKHMARMGLIGCTRPRWWFEAARLTWIVFLFLALSFPITFFFKFFNVLNQFNIINGIGAIYFLFTFLVTATIAYLLGILRHWRFRGRAFECVHFFYFMIISMFLIATAESYWPPENIWPEGTIMTLLGMTGITVLTFGFLSFVKQFEHFEAE